jgi:hypothetical protein
VPTQEESVLAFMLQNRPFNDGLRLPAVVLFLSLSLAAFGQASGASSSTKHTGHSAPVEKSTLDPGSVVNGVYRNATLRFSCKIPAGWVLRTEEMNTPEEPSSGPPSASAPGKGPKVLLAAFSRPPEARGEDVNASILIAAEPASTYPGLTDAAQYIGPVSEIAKAQGFTADEDPYETAIGTKTLPRSDFHKDAGSRVIRQSTLTMLDHGYAISITMIGGTEDEVETLIDGLQFGPSPRPAPPSR